MYALVILGFTASHAVEHGFRTTLIEDASRGVDLNDIANMRDSLISKGINMANSDQVSYLKLALRLKLS